MKEKLKINFVDFWNNLNKGDNYFTRILSKKYNVEISENPDLLFYSFNGDKNKEYKCHKIYFTGENIRPNFNECDYAFSFDYIKDNPRNYRLPLYALYNDPKKLTEEKDIEKIISTKDKFCSFVVSNKFSKKRIEFFKLLSKYKKVDSGGRILNNIGGPIKDKKDLLIHYKFNIAFENCIEPGYTTEKIFEPMIHNTIPIYYGNPLINLDFNEKSFINGNGKKLKDIVDIVVEIDKNDKLYKRMLSEPFFTDNKVNEYINEDNILNQFEFIINDMKTKTPISEIYYSKKDKLKGIKNKLKRIKKEIVKILPIDQEFRF